MLAAEDFRHVCIRPLAGTSQLGLLRYAMCWRRRIFATSVHVCPRPLAGTSRLGLLRYALYKWRQIFTRLVHMHLQELPGSAYYILLMHWRRIFATAVQCTWAFAGTSRPAAIVTYCYVRLAPDFGHACVLGYSFPFAHVPLNVQCWNRNLPHLVHLGCICLCVEKVVGIARMRTRSRSLKSKS